MALLYQNVGNWSRAVAQYGSILERRPDEAETLARLGVCLSGLGRHRLAVSLSEDEGQSWRWTRYLERDADATDARQVGQYHYPSIIQAADGTLHATYSLFAPEASVKPDGENRLPRKAIKHAHFNEAWIKEVASSQ